MRYWWLIAQRDFLSNLLTLRFAMGSMLCLLSISIATYVQVDNYEKQRQAYTTSVNRHQAEVNDWDVYIKTNPKVDKKPTPLSIFAQGVERQGFDTISIELGEIPWSGLAQRQGSDNPLLETFLSIDLTVVFQIMIGLLAMLLAYDAVSGEREEGTLRLMLSNPVPRGTILLGKYVGGMLSLLPVLILSFLVALLITQAFPGVAFGGMDLFRILLMFVASLLYVSCCYLLSLFLSTRTREATTTLILAVLVWLVLTTIYPNAVGFIVSQSQGVGLEPGDAEKSQAMQVWNEFSQARMVHFQSKGHSGLPWFEGLERLDGYIRGFGYKEHYTFRDVPSDADFSWFTEGTRYQEPLRYQYAERAGRIVKAHERRVQRAQRLIWNLCLLSPSEAYGAGAAILAGTDSQRQVDFLEQARQYRQAVIRYLTQKQAFATREWVESGLAKADFTGMPVFRERHADISRNLERTLPNLLMLLLSSMGFFLGAYASFLRYDVR